MNQLRLAVLLVVGLLIGTAGPALAQATTKTTTLTMRVSGVVNYGCVGEPLLIEGVAHGTSHQNTDATGGWGDIQFSSFAGSALGLTSGTRYRMFALQMDNQTHVSENGAVETTGLFIYRFTAVGGQDSFYSHVTYHLTRNANGEWTAEPVNTRTECAQ